VDVQLPNNPVPIFPLRGLYLFPHQVLPLHIFEPRYRRMIADLLDGPGRLVLGSPLRGAPARDDTPPLQSIAGLGEILRHEKLPDGRYMVWIVGLARVGIDEVPSEHLYRLVRCRPFAEVEATADEIEELAPALRAATSERLKEPLPLPDNAPMGLLADLLLQTLGASPLVMERAFAEPSVTTRARYVLRAARRARRAEPESPDEPIDPS
jgi:uncharacterized protein